MLGGLVYPRKGALVSARDQLLKMQRNILRQLKQSVGKLQGELPPQVAKYYSEYEQELKSYREISSKSALLEAIQKVDIVFGADFHAYGQSQRTHLRLLRDLVRDDRPVILALEAINSRHQAHIERFLAGETTDHEFLSKIRYQRTWGFPWENYSVLFEFARRHDLLVYGINKNYSHKVVKLKDRDRHSGAEIAKIRKKHPDSLIYVIYGDSHLASSHLPRVTKRFLGKRDKARFLTVFQNPDELYWKLAKKRLEEKVDVLKLKKDVYCVVNSPPWIKWQAYLVFLEKELDLELDETSQPVDHDAIYQYVQMIKRLWKVDGRFQDFHVFSMGDGQFARFIGKHLASKDMAYVDKLLAQDRSFFLPRVNVWYLIAPTVNHIAALAGQYIHSVVSGQKLVERKYPRDFLSSIWNEAIGFFASKMLNPHRRFKSVRDLPRHSLTTLLVLQQQLLEQAAIRTQKSKFLLSLKGKPSTNQFVEASRILGAILGHRIYVAFQGGEISVDTLHRWLHHKVDGGVKFSSFYLKVLGGLKAIPYPEHRKAERL